MRAAVFSTKPYDQEFLNAANRERRHELVFIEPRLTIETAALAAGCVAVVVFVNDKLDANVLSRLHNAGTRLIALRCAGYDHVDRECARSLGMSVCHAPHYSPHAVAEHTVALLLSVNRGIHRAHARIAKGNFSLNGLMGFDLYGKTVGLVGTGQIGAIVGTIMSGFGCKVLAYDPARPELSDTKITFTTLEELLHVSDVVSLHCPLTPKNRHLIDHSAFERMKRGATLINTSRGGLVDTEAAIHALSTGQLGRMAIDVYEAEAEFFYEDRTDQPIEDPIFEKLISFPNVLVTGHQGFLTHEAVSTIAETIIASLDAFESARPPPYPLR